MNSFLLRKEAWVKANELSVVMLIALTALAYRAVFFFQFRTSLYYDVPMVDAARYDDLGWRILEGSWPGNNVFYQDPLYPGFLSIIYYLFGRNQVPVIIFQFGFGVVGSVLVYFVAKQVFKGFPLRRSMAGVSGFLFASNTVLVFYEGFLLKTSLGLFLTLLHFLLLLQAVNFFRDRRKLLIFVYLAGITLGLNLINRGNYILLLPGFALWLYWIGVRSGARIRVRETRTLAAVAVIVYLLGAVTVVAPITLKNYSVNGDIILVTSQGGQNFYIGNNKHNTTGSYQAPSWLRPTPIYEEEDMKRFAEKNTGRTMLSSEISRYYFVLGARWIVGDPLSAFKLMLRKLGLWFSGKEIPDNHDFDFLKENFAPVLNYTISNGYVLNWLGWLGFFIYISQLGMRKNIAGFIGGPGVVLVAGFLVIYSVSIILFFVFSRYRVPIYPFLMIMSAYFMYWMVARFGKISASRKVILAVGSIGLLTVILLPNTHAIPNSYFGAYVNLGTSYMRRNDLESAEKMWKKALKEPVTNLHHVEGMADGYLDYMHKPEKAIPLYSFLIRNHWRKQRNQGRLDAARQQIENKDETTAE